MNKIIYIGMDVHSSNFTLCSFEPGYGMTEDKIFGQVQFKEDLIKNTEKYINSKRTCNPCYLRDCRTALSLARQRI